MGRNYLSIPKLQWCNRWSLGMDKQFHPTLYWTCDYLSMLGLHTFPDNTDLRVGIDWTSTRRERLMFNRGGGGGGGVAISVLPLIWYQLNSSAIPRVKACKRNDYHIVQATLNWARSVRENHHHHKYDIGFETNYIADWKTSFRCWQIQYLEYLFIAFHSDLF